jgi:hypothetical protein
MNVIVDRLYEQHLRFLPDIEQLRLVERIVQGIAEHHEDDGPVPRDIMELHGKGAEVWRGVDAEEYVEELRNEWEHRP